MSRRRGDRRTLGTLLAMAYWARGSSMNEEVNRMLLEARAIGHELDDDLVSGEARSLAALLASLLLTVVLCVVMRKRLTRDQRLALDAREPF